MAFPTSQPRYTTICLPPFFSRPSEAHACLYPAIMSNSSSSSHAQWQGACRWKHDWNGAWNGWDVSTDTAAPSASEADLRRSASRCRDHVQQAMVIFQRRSQKTLTEQSASKTKGNAAHEAMEAATQAREWQAETRR